MPIGYGLLTAALIFTVVANVLFPLSRRGGAEAEKWLKWARLSTVGAAGMVIGASLYLIYLIANHHFEVSYVAEYSAKRSAAYYLFAAFWGGQEGSLLLWAFWGSVLGAVLAFRAGKETNRVWPIYGLTQVFLLGLILLKCPFKLGEGSIPLDGKGLNPLLENMWMVIHPPILFLGFASTMPVFAWCLYGLVYREYDRWAKAVFPWALFAFATLGFGLSLGGYWAYETLGWGGFWGWDPVENSSLVPWLFLMTLIHGLLLQGKNGGYKVSNLLIGFLPFATMLYGTFLTRTGLLSDFSVHSFSSLGKDGYTMLLIGVLSTFLIPLGLLIFQWKSIPKPTAYEKPLTREFGFFLASALLGLTGFLVAIGMSAPLITKGIGQAAQAVLPALKMTVPTNIAQWVEKGAAAQTDFYNQSLYPIAIILLVAMAVTPFLGWRMTDDAELGKRLLKPYIASLILTGIMTGCAWYMGIRKPLMVLLFACSAFTIASNIALILPRTRTRQARMTIGGFVAHLGVGMTLAGVACLVAFSQTAERVLLVRDMPKDVLGFNMTYKGQTSQPYDRANNGLMIEIRKGSYIWRAAPTFYIAPWNNEDTTFGNPPAILPSIYNVKTPYDLLRLLPWNNPFPAGDLYIALNSADGPVSLDAPMLPPSPNKGFALKLGQGVTIGEYSFVFREFKFDEAAEKAMGKPEEMKKLPEIRVLTAIDVTYNGKTETVTPRLRQERAGGVYSEPVQIAGPEGRTVMLKLDPPSREQQEAASPEIHLRTLNADNRAEAVQIDVSTKPGIGFVWIGSLLYTLGGLVAYRRRARELGITGLEDPEPAANNAGKANPAPVIRRKKK
jgi:cytochrome c-type biogenesis protein CcmF